MRAALVTGAARGLGLAIARGLAQAGVRVALTDIDADGAQAAARLLRAEGHETLALRLDVRDHVTGTPRFGLPQDLISGAIFPISGSAHSVEIAAGFTLHFGD